MFSPTYQTMNSILYNPSLDCEDSEFFKSHNKEDFISKITRVNDIDSELNMYKKINKILPNMKTIDNAEKYKDSPFFDIDKIFKCKLPSDVVEKLYNNKIFDKHFNHEYQLITPFLSYPDFSVFLLSFRLNNNYFRNYDGYTGINDKKKDIITVSIFKNAITALYNLYLKLNELNNYNFYHNDIKSNNIMFNPVTGEMKMIDLGDATFMESKNEEKINDILKLLIIIKDLLYVATCNNYIFEEMVDYIRNLEHIQYDQYFKVDINEKREKVNSLIEDIYNKTLSLDINNSVTENVIVLNLPLEKGKFRELTYKEQIENTRNFIIKSSKSNSKSKSKSKGGKSRKNKRKSNRNNLG